MSPSGSAFADELADYQHDENLLIVSHQGVLSLLTALLLGIPTASMWRLTHRPRCLEHDRLAAS
ncbi:histidine phosphatase family protein [Shigella flexneri]